MQALKDYFLLAKGDFFQSFLEESRLVMRLPPRPSSEADLNIPFQQSALRSSAGVDPHFDHIKVRASPLPSNSPLPP
jgi:gamma-tubulin complex component 4